MSEEQEVVQVKCSRCGKVFFAPMEGERIVLLDRKPPKQKVRIVRCPECGKKFKITDEVILNNK